MATQPLHLALVIRGGYKTSAVEIRDEIWVNTLNLAVQLDAFTATVGTIPDNFEVVHDDLSDTGTGWHGQSDWRLEGGISTSTLCPTSSTRSTPPSSPGWAWPVAPRPPW